MLPSSNSNNPFESSFKQSPFNLSDQNPASKQQLHHHPPFLFNNFPSQFFDENELPLNQILLRNPPMPAITPTKQEEQTETGQKRRTKSSLGAVPRRRTGKKDRHSKICTAQGIRDRRMRLSLQVARKFFDLQDMLGYDKASKTIEWLFTKSKKAIRELAKDHPQGKSISECVGEKNISNSDHDFKVSVENYVKSCEKKPAFSMRESRDKARERARCRTREKMMIKNMENNIESNPNLDQKLGFSISEIQFEGVDQELNSCDQERVFSYGDYCSSFDDDVGTIEKLLGNSTNSSSSNSGYNNIDPNSDFMGFLGNWDMFNNERTNSIHYGVTNQVALAGNLSSIFLDTPKFP